MTIGLMDSTYIFNKPNETANTGSKATSRFDTEFRSLPTNYEDCDLALDLHGREPSRIFIEDYLKRHQSASNAKVRLPWLCFVDDCNSVGPRQSIPQHLRAQHGIVDLISAWQNETLEEWMAVHPYQCPTKACDRYWRGLATLQPFMAVRCLIWMRTMMEKRFLILLLTMTDFHMRRMLQIGWISFLTPQTGQPKLACSWLIQRTASTALMFRIAQAYRRERSGYSHDSHVVGAGTACYYYKCT